MQFYISLFVFSVFFFYRFKILFKTQSKFLSNCDNAECRAQSTEKHIKSVNSSIRQFANSLIHPLWLRFKGIFQSFNLSIFQSPPKWEVGRPSPFLLLLILLSVILILPTNLFAAANYVYHGTAENEQSDNPAGHYYRRSISDSWSVYSGESVTIGVKVEYKDWVDNTKIAFTTNGDSPTINDNQTALDWWADGSDVGGGNYPQMWGKGSVIPPQPAGTTVKYILWSYHSGGGDWIYANSSDKTDQGDADVFEFTVLPLSTPTDFTAVKSSTYPNTTINISWTKWNDKAVLLVAREGEDLSADPTNGVAYNPNDSLGGGKVLYRGDAVTSYIHNSSDTYLPIVAGKKYYYRIYTENWSYYSTAVSANETPCTEPTTPVVSISPAGWTNTDSFSILITTPATHAAVSVEYKYQIGGAAPTDTSAGINFGSADTFGISVTGTGGETTIYVFAVANYGSGFYTKSENVTVTAKLDKTAPATISDFDSSTLAHDTVSLSWTAVGDDSLSPWNTYEIFYTTDGGEPTDASSKFDKDDFGILGIRTTNSIILSGLSQNTNYKMRIRGIDGAGNAGVLSNTVSFTTDEVVGNAAPTIISIAVVSGNIDTFVAGETYSIRVIYNDANSVEEIDSMSIQLADGTDTLHFWTYLGQTPVAESGGDSILGTVTVDTSVTTVNQITCTWTFALNWNFNESENYKIYARARDTEPLWGEWDDAGADAKPFIKTLGLYGTLTNNQSLTGGGTIPVETTINWTGLTVYYKNTDIIPDESYFNFLLTDHTSTEWKQTSGTTLNMNYYTGSDEIPTAGCTWTLTDLPAGGQFDDATTENISFEIVRPDFSDPEYKPYNTIDLISTTQDEFRQGETFPAELGNTFLGMTWDTEYIYFGFKSVRDWRNDASDSDRLHIYIDNSAEANTNGSNLSLFEAGTHTLPFYANYLAYIQPYNIVYKDLRLSSNWNTHNDPDLITAATHNDSGWIEFSIKWSDIGSPESIKIIAMIINGNSNWCWNVSPSANPVNSGSYSSLTMTDYHTIHLDRNSDNLLDANIIVNQDTGIADYIGISASNDTMLSTSLSNYIDITANIRSDGQFGTKLHYEPVEFSIIDGSGYASIGIADTITNVDGQVTMKLHPQLGETGSVTVRAYNPIMGIQDDITVFIERSDIDTDSPAYTINTPQNQWYSSNPLFDVDFFDAFGIDTVFYQIDTYAGVWKHITSDGNTEIGKNLQNVGIITNFDTNFYISDTDWATLNHNETYTIYFKASDNSGFETGTTETTAKALTIKIDKEEPVITVNKSYYTMKSNSVVIDVDFFDTYSQLKKAQYKVGTTYYTIFESTLTNYDTNFYLTSGYAGIPNGTDYELEIRVENNAGNITTDYITINKNPITINGDLTDWTITELIETRNSKDFYMTWDDVHLYIAYSNTDLSEADVFVYIGTSNNHNGTTSPVDWGGYTAEHSFPFSATAGFCFENGSFDDEGAGRFEFQLYDGAAWQYQTNENLQLFGGWAAVPNTELKISWDRLGGKPDTMAVIVFHQWNTQKNVYNSLPSQNPAPNTETDVTFTNYYLYQDMSDTIQKNIVKFNSFNISSDTDYINSGDTFTVSYTATDGFDRTIDNVNANITVSVIPHVGLTRTSGSVANSTGSLATAFNTTSAPSGEYTVRVRLTSDANVRGETTMYVAGAPQIVTSHTSGRGYDTNEWNMILSCSTPVGLDTGYWTLNTTNPVGNENYLFQNLNNIYYDTTFNLPADSWLALSPGQHTVRFYAIDKNNAMTTLAYNFFNDNIPPNVIVNDTYYLFKSSPADMGNVIDIDFFDNLTKIDSAWITTSTHTDTQTVVSQHTSNYYFNKWAIPAGFPLNTGENIIYVYAQDEANNISDSKYFVVDYQPIDINNRLADFTDSDLVESSAGNLNELYLTWDNTYFYAGLKGINIATDSGFIIFDTNPGTASGATAASSPYYNLRFAGSNLPESAIAFKGYNGNITLDKRDSSGNLSGAINVDTYSYSTDGTESIIRIPRAHIHGNTNINTDKMGIAVVYNNALSSYVWRTFPATNDTGAVSVGDPLIVRDFHVFEDLCIDYNEKKYEVLTLTHFDSAIIATQPSFQIELIARNTAGDTLKGYSNNLSVSLQSGIGDITPHSISFTNGYAKAFLYFTDAGEKTVRFTANKQGGFTSVTSDKNITVTETVSPFEKPAWVQDAIVYNILVDKFVDGEPSNNTAGQTGGIESSGGDLQGIINKIKSNYFQNLGVTLLYLSPVYPVHEPDTSLPDQGGWLGFDPVCLFDVRPAYGGMSTMEELIDIGLKNNIKIIIDQPRFMSWQHPLFRNRDGSYNTEKINSGFWRIWWDDVAQVYRSQLPAGQDFGLLSPNHENAEVVQYLIDQSVWWYNKGLAGMRYDVATFYGEKNSFGTLDPPGWWGGFSAGLKPNAPDFFTVGEVIHWNDGPWETRWYVSKGRMDGHKLNILHDQQGPEGNKENNGALKRYFMQKWANGSEFIGPDPVQIGNGNVYYGAKAVEDALFNNYSYAGTDFGNARMFYWLTNHDRPRFLTESYAIYNNYEKAVGALRGAMTFGHAWTQIPMIYNGDEIGMYGTGGSPSYQEGGERGSYEDFISNYGQDDDILNMYQMMGFLRRYYATLRQDADPGPNIHYLYYGDYSEPMAFMRSGTPNILYVWNNNQDVEQIIDIYVGDYASVGDTFANAFLNNDGSLSNDTWTVNSSGNINVTLQPHQAMILIHGGRKNIVTDAVIQIKRGEVPVAEALVYIEAGDDTFYRMTDSNGELSFKYFYEDTYTVFVERGSYSIQYENVYIRQDYTNVLNDGDYVNTPPAKPELVFPANNAVVEYANMKFQWSFVDADTGDYQTKVQIQIDKTGSLTSPLYDTTLTTSNSQVSNIFNLPENDTYYWRVKLWDSFDSESVWSDTRSFYLNMPDVMINIDGRLVWQEWPDASVIPAFGRPEPYDFRFAGDEDNFYFAMNKGAQISANDKMIIYFDTAPGIGQPAGENINGIAHQLPFDANYMIVYSINDNDIDLKKWNGAEWVEAVFSGSKARNISAGSVEIRIPKSIIDSPNELNLLFTVIDGIDNLLWGVAPNANKINYFGAEEVVLKTYLSYSDINSITDWNNRDYYKNIENIALDISTRNLFTPSIDGARDIGWGTVPFITSNEYAQPGGLTRGDDNWSIDSGLVSDVFITNDLNYLYLAWRAQGDHYEYEMDGRLASAHYAFLIYTDTSPAGISHDPWIDGRTTRVENYLPDYWVSGYVTYGAQDFGGLFLYKKDYADWTLDKTLVPGEDYKMSVYTNRWGELRLPLSDLNLNVDDIAGIIMIARHSDAKPGITDIGPWQENAAADWGDTSAFIDGSKSKFYKIGQSIVNVFHRPSDQPVTGKSIMREPLNPYSIDNVNIKVAVSSSLSISSVAVIYSLDDWNTYDTTVLTYSFLSGGHAYYEGLIPEANIKSDTVKYYIRVRGLSGLSNYIYGNDNISNVTPNLATAQTEAFSYYILNSPPTKPTVTITPVTPNLSQNLTATASGSVDVDESDTLTYIFHWYKDGIHQPQYNEIKDTELYNSIILSDSTSFAENWYCKVYVFDGTDTSEPGISNVIRFSEFVDWTGTPPDEINSAVISGNEWIWCDAVNDHRQLPANHISHDIKEVRIKFDTEYVNFRITMQDITDINLPHIAIAFDTDNASSNMSYLFGDESKLYIGNNYYDSATPDVQISVHNIQYNAFPIIEIKYGDNNWQDVSTEDYQVYIDKDVNIIEWKIKRETLTLSASGIVNSRIASFRNRLVKASQDKSIAGFSNVDALDILSINGYYGINTNYNDNQNNNTVLQKEFFNWKSDFYFGINYDVDGIVTHLLPNKISTPIPENDSTVEAAVITLEWAQSAEDTVTSYLLELNNTANFSGNVIYRVNLHKDSYSFEIPETLTINNTYYWRVRARDISGCLSDYDTWSFYYEGIPPIYVNAPLDLNNVDNYLRIQGQQSASAEINWYWAPAIHTAGWTIKNYEIQISDDINFSNLIIQDTIYGTVEEGCTTFYQISTDSAALLSRANTYYARIRAGDTATPQNWSDWSESSNGIYLNLKSVSASGEGWFSSDTYTKNTAVHFSSPYYSGTWFDTYSDHRMDRDENAHLDMKEFHVSTDKHNIYIYIKFYETYADGYHFVQIPVSFNRNSDVRAFRGDRGPYEDSFTSAEASWNYLIQAITGQDVAFVWDNTFQTTGVGRFVKNIAGNAFEIAIPLAIMGGNSHFRNNSSIRMTPAVFFNDNGNVGQSGAGNSNIVDCITNELLVWNDVQDNVVDYYLEVSISDTYVINDFKGVNVSWTPRPPMPNPDGAPKGHIRDMIIYNVFVDRFWDGYDDNQPNDADMMGGDFDGLIEKSDYINWLGFNTLKLSAEADFGGGVWGYNQHDIYKVQGSYVRDHNNKFRGWDCFVRMVKELRHKNIGLGPDWVPGQIYGNESSGGTIDRNPWMWFGERFGGRRILQYTADVRQFWVDNTRFLWSLGVVHLRVDNPKFYPDPAEQGYPFAKYWRVKTDQFAPDLYTFGEVPDGPGVIGAFCKDGERFTGMLNMPTAYSLWEWAGGWMSSGDLISSVVGNEAHYRGAVNPVMIIYYNNHDYERTIHKVGGNIYGLQSLFLYMMAMDGVPYMFYGDEIGMEGAREMTYPGWEHTGNTGAFGNTRPMAWDYFGASPAIKDTVRKATVARSIFNPLRWDNGAREFETRGDGGLVVRRGGHGTYEVVALLTTSNGGAINFQNFYTYNPNTQYRDWFSGGYVWSDGSGKINEWGVGSNYAAYLVKNNYNTNKFYVRVVDTNNQPIEGAIVSINNRSSWTRETDENGYVFMDLITLWEGEGASKYIKAWKKGYSTYEDHWDFWWVDDHQIEGTIVLENDDGIAPAVPIGLSAVSRDRAVVLNWAANTESDFESYHIYRSKTPGIAAMAPDEQEEKRIMEVIRNTYYDHDLDRYLNNNDTYYYVVRAMDKNENMSGFSNEISVVPAPTQVTFQVDMSQSGLQNITQVYMKGNHRNISRSDFNTGYKMPDIDPILPLEYVGRGIWEKTVELDPTININYIFVANHNNGNDWYDEHGFFNTYTYENARGITIQNPTDKKQAVVRRWMVAGPTNPQKPIGLTAIPRNQSIRLGWSLNLERNIDYYEIWRSTNGTDYSWVKNVAADVINFNDNNLSNGTTYYYRIKATNSFGYASEYSDAVTAIPTDVADTVPPDAPTGITAIGNDLNSIKLSWDYNTEGDLAGYNVYRSTKADFSSDTIQLNSTLITPTFNPQYVDNNVDAGQQYYYEVVALDDVFNISTPSDTIAVKLARLTFKIDMGNIDLYNVNFTSNLEYIGLEPGKNMVFDTSTSSTYKYTNDFIVGRNMLYKYAYNDGSVKERNFSTASQQRELIVPNVSSRTYIHDWNENPQRITDLSGQPDSGAVWLFWSENTDDADLEGYNVYYQAETDEDWNLFTATPIENNYIRVDGLINGKNYTFAIRTIDSGDLKLESENSNTVTVTPAGVVYVHFRN